VIITGYWNAYKLDIPMQLPMAMADGNGRWQWPMAMADGNGDGNDEQRAEATIDAAESRRGSYYDCRLRISPRLLSVIPMITYTWYKIQVRN
jgi:hypothetical protein